MKILSKTLLLSAGLLCAFSFSQAKDINKPAVQTTTHVVELFTSQGCSSCPPANKTVVKISDDPGVLALSYGVTYWDYLGWKDTFGDPKFTERQRDYREALDGANLYTPQIVLNGSVHSPRYSTKDIRSMPMDKAVYGGEISVAEGRFVVTSDAPAGGILAFVEYTPGTQDVAVRRGENGGRTLQLANVVTDIVQVNWTGQPMALAETPEKGKAYAALFHAPETAKIIAVATYRP